ncbi:MAG: ketoacyl-ACP synthase III [Prevotellaceae bacterium]|jgi:3-oxoacyl-[acyl-carrier-protein] synthase-3|nr:ketoacyl-ACP synthase III [Prevotellaceae bacterium]
MSCKISNIAYYLPEKILTNEELSGQFPDWTPEKIEEKIGVRERRIVGENETALDLAFAACEKLFSENNINKSEIDFLLLCTQSPDYYLPTSACILQDKLGLRQETGALDFNLGCSGFVYGLAVAKGLIEAKIAQKILLVTAETYSKYINPQDKGNRTIFGDGAAATLVEFSENSQILNFELGTDGSGYKNLIVPNGAARHKFDANAQIISEENLVTENDLYMNGGEIFTFTIQKIPVLVKNTLIKNELTADEIDYYVFHQANKYILDYLRKKLKISEDKFYNNLLLTGNTVSSTIPLAIKDLTDNGTLKKGMKVLLAGFGVGLSWGATVIEI